MTQPAAQPTRTIREALELLVRELTAYAGKNGLGPVKLQYALFEGERALAAQPSKDVWRFLVSAALHNAIYHATHPIPSSETYIKQLREAQAAVSTIFPIGAPTLITTVGVQLTVERYNQLLEESLPSPDALREKIEAQVTTIRDSMIERCAEFEGGIQIPVGKAMTDFWIRSLNDVLALLAGGDK